MNAVILMTRLPHPGATKTRLMPLLTPDQCAELHEAFLKDVGRCLEALSPQTALFIAFAPEHCSEALLRRLPTVGERFVQRGEALGDRMAHAFETVLGRGYDRVVLLGSDIPQLQPATIEGAFRELEEEDLVFGPTFDGGYYLVGMKRLHGAIFSKGLHWGNHSVLEETCRIANRLGLTAALVEKQRDVDTPEDLKQLYHQLAQGRETLPCFPAETYRYLAEYLGEDRHHGPLESAN